MLLDISRTTRVAAIVMYRSAHNPIPDSLDGLRHADYRAMLRSESVLDEWQYERSEANSAFDRNCG